MHVRRQLGRRLNLRALDGHGAMPGVDLVQLAVSDGTAGGGASMRAGFRHLRCRADALRVDGRSYAEEHMWRRLRCRAIA